MEESIISVIDSGGVRSIMLMMGLGQSGQHTGRVGGILSSPDHLQPTSI